MRLRKRFGVWTGLKLAAMALPLWSGVMILFVDIDKLAGRW